MSKLKLKARTLVVALSISFALVMSGCTYQIALVVEDAAGFEVGE